MKLKNCILVALCIVATSSQASHAALQSVLPEFKSKQALQAHAASRQVNKEPLGNVFYTGKPYDNTDSSYLFKGRTYNSTLSRWTSTDPSGFPDGANNSIYAPNPLTQLDPNGLDTVNVTWTPQTGPSGGVLSFTVSPPDAHPITPDATMIVSWHVNSSYSGWIVQHVQMDLSGIYNDSDNSQYTPGGSGVTSYDYWEAWQVTSGSISPSSTDQYTLAYPSSTHGSASITGQVNFFQSSVFTNLTGNNNPANWSTGSSVSGAEPAHDLKATATSPSFWSDSGYNHNMSMTWE